MTRPVAAGQRPGAWVDDGIGAMGALDRLAEHRAPEEGRHCAETQAATRSSVDRLVAREPRGGESTGQERVPDTLYADEHAVRVVLGQRRQALELTLPRR